MGDRSRLRLVILQVLVVSILATLLGRLWFLQVHEGDSYRKAANANRVRAVVTESARGQILDAYGRDLVRNRTALVVSVNRSLLRLTKDRGKTVLARLAPIVGISAADLEKTIAPCTKLNGPPTCWNGSPYQPVPVKIYAAEDPLQLQKVLAVEEHPEDFPGVTAEYQAIREYPDGTLASHVLGYLGPITDERTNPAYTDAVANALVGKSGIEQTYDVALRGVDGVQRLLVDKDGNVTGTTGTTAPVAGDKLVLSIDENIQKVAEKALQDGILAARQTPDLRNRPYINFRATAGTVIVMEAKTGRIAAMASYPNYAPADFQQRFTQAEFEAKFGEAAGSPLTSRATQGLFAPGSTFKVVSTSAAVQQGHPLSDSYNCTPTYTAGNRVFNNFDGEAFGPLSLHQALVVSCDTIFYRFGYDMWLSDGGTRNSPGAKEAMVKMAKSWGFGSDTGVDLPSESQGRIADRAFKQRAYDQLKDQKCANAKKGYPDVAATDPQRAAYLTALAREFCADGYVYRAGDAINFAVGQGDTLVTPLQLAAAYGALANGGTLYEPRIGKALLSADGRTVTPIPPVVKGHLDVDPATLAYLRDALAGVTDPAQGGTAKSAFAGFDRSRLVVAGKTGTAEVVGKQDTSWFASMAPAADPEYVVVTMVEQGGTGATTAAPITAKIYEGIYGLNGQPAAVPGGHLPTTLPRVRPDGTVAMADEPLVGPAPKILAPFGASPKPTAPAGTPAKSAGGALLAPDLWADLARRPVRPRGRRVPRGRPGRRGSGPRQSGGRESGGNDGGR